MLRLALGREDPHSIGEFSDDFIGSRRGALLGLLSGGFPHRAFRHDGWQNVILSAERQGRKVCHAGIRLPSRHVTSRFSFRKKRIYANVFLGPFSDPDVLGSDREAFERT
jgi:hypothetical protein